MPACLGLSSRHNLRGPHSERKEAFVSIAAAVHLERVISPCSDYHHCLVHWALSKFRVAKTQVREIRITCLGISGLSKGWPSRHKNPDAGSESLSGLTPSPKYYTFYIPEAFGNVSLQF